MKIIIIFLLIFYPFNSFAKYLIVKENIKRQYKSHIGYNNNKYTWVDIETTTAAHWNSSYDCPSVGSRTEAHKNSKNIISKTIGFFRCVENNTTNDPDAGSLIIEDGLIYSFKKSPTFSREVKRDFLRKGVIKKDQDNPILFAEIIIKKDDKTSYSFYILKSDVHYQNFNGYLYIDFSVQEKRRKNEWGFYRETKPRQFGLNQIKNDNVKKLYNTLFEVEKHFLNFDKKKFKPKKLDPRIVDYLLSIKPTQEWVYSTNMSGR
ncbi:hypothetical protein [Candidatus Pelagibacter sp. HIMB1495]|uniref:hypothetical protein n=1 Tax=unclassified Candidatus Pelagibacter TaxID=2647897 RepID=UPI003F86754F